MGKRTGKKAGKKGHKHAPSTSKKKDRAVKKELRKSKGKGGSSVYKTEWTAFAKQLLPYGLCLNDTVADGNCFFRAVADQLEGDEHMWKSYRSSVVEYMKVHPELFKPFMEEDYDEYLDEMSRSGTWGGHLEMLALGIQYNIDVIVHQLNAPRLELRNQFADEENPVEREVHISYHSGSHYASVRTLEDPKTGPALQIQLSSSVVIPKVNSDKYARIVSDLTGCKNMEHVQTCLENHGMDIDSAVEVLVAEKESGMSTTIWGVLDENSSENEREVEEPKDTKGLSNKSRKECARRRKETARKLKQDKKREKRTHANDRKVDDEELDIVEAIGSLQI